MTTRQVTTTAQKVQEGPNENNQPPEGAIRAEEAGFLPPSTNEDVMHMRWQSQELIAELWRSLANRHFIQKNGEAYLVKRGSDSLLSDDGANELISQVRAMINPVVSLSKTSEADARGMWAKCMRRIARVLVIEEERYGCESRSKKEMIMNICEPLIWSQFMRAVDGHESEMAATNIQRGEQSMHYDVNDRRKYKMPLPFSKGGGNS